MAETLGQLCDKLTIIKLKQWHSTEPAKLVSLQQQEIQLQDEINEFMSAALSGQIPLQRLTFSSNKVFKGEGIEVPSAKENFGELVSQLSRANCELWHLQEKVYDFEKVPLPQKDSVVKGLAILNLERNQCIDRIDAIFSKFIAGELLKSR